MNAPCSPDLDSNDHNQTSHHARRKTHHDGEHEHGIEIVPVQHTIVSMLLAMNIAPLVTRQSAVMSFVEVDFANNSAVA